MARTERRRLQDAADEHREALRDLQDEINLDAPDAIPAAVAREQTAHDDLQRARHEASRTTRSNASKKDGTPPAR